MAELDTKRIELQNKQLEPPAEIIKKYLPAKRRRLIRRQVYERYYDLRDNPLRKEAEDDWRVADKEYNMYVPEIDPDDWQSHLQLPDAFAAIQAQAQETIERKARPILTPTEQSDEPIAEFSNAVMEYNMNNTGYDYQYSLAKLAAAIRGTAFLVDYWRVDKRTVKDPTGLKDGEVEYQDKEITDFDDDFTEWVPNEFIYIDERAKHVDEATDFIRREILNIDEFHRIYDSKPGFFDTEFVYPGGETTTRSFFQLPKDITEQDVEVLHYYNRSIDAYWVAANNVTVHDSPLPTKHKELPLAVLYQYRVPGRFWGMGIPKVIHFLSEERKTIRNLNMDRQKLQIGGAFLHNSGFELDDEDMQLYPGRVISVDTSGQAIDQAIKRLEFGDVPFSYFRTEEILLEDIRRAHGIDDRIQGVNVGGTATEAAILKESALKRVNLISITAEMDTVVRIGRLKWSNIQFFYPVPRLEKIVRDNQVKDSKTYRKITVNNRKFEIVDDAGRKALRMDDIRGKSALSLDASMAKYLQGSFDVSVSADIFTPISKAIEQTKKTELFTVGLSNPATLAVMDITSAFADVLKVNNIEPDKWLKNTSGRKDTMMLAESENMVMSVGQPLDATEGATEDHTLVHLMYTKTQDFSELQPEFQQLIMDHIMQEHDKNPATGKSADLMGAYGLMPEQLGAGVPEGMAPEGMNTPFGSPEAPPEAPPQAQVADLQPTNFANLE